MENSSFSFLFAHTEAVYTHRSGCLSFESGWKWSCHVAASRLTWIKMRVQILQRLLTFRMGWMKTSNTNPFSCTKMRVVAIWRAGSAPILSMLPPLYWRDITQCWSWSGAENSVKLRGVHTDYDSSRKCCITWYFATSISLLDCVNSTSCRSHISGGSSWEHPKHTQRSCSVPSCRTSLNLHLS